MTAGMRDVLGPAKGGSADVVTEGGVPLAVARAGQPQALPVKKSKNDVAELTASSGDRLGWIVDIDHGS
jgi:hypothetical protein